jgi:hypothetical protein
MNICWAISPAPSARWLQRSSSRRLRRLCWPSHWRGSWTALRPPSRAPLSDPDYKSYDHENASGHHGGERARHPNAHRNLDEGEIVIHAGGLTLSAGRSRSAELRESEITLVSMKPHFGHSKVRFSVRPVRGTILVRFIRVRHLAQRSRSIGASITSVSESGMVLTWRTNLGS